MPTVSLCMIVKNEEDVLGRCLRSVAALVDEIIIVDTGSTDRTKEIARTFTDKVHDFEWIDDFAAARNDSFSRARMDYCMWLDADDILLAEDQAAFAALKETLPDTVRVVMMPYHTAFDAQGNPTFSYYRERLIRNHQGFVWKGAVHEAIEPAGEVRYCECAVTHRKLHPSDPERNVRILGKLAESGTLLEPRLQFYYGRELYCHGRHDEALEILERFLDEGKGWVENNIEACRYRAFCLYALGREGQALRALLASLAYDRPRAETACDIGRHFYDRGRYDLAAYWYAAALAGTRDDRRGGFVSPDCYGYVPCIQLCVCYSHLGNLEKAERMNELAASFKPDDPAVAQNREYFAQLRRAGQMPSAQESESPPSLG